MTAKLKGQASQTLSRQAQLYQRAQQVMPGGCSRNTILREPHPIYAKSASGCYIQDIDGNQYIDFANNMAALIHGHAHPVITEAVSAQLRKGSAFTFATEVEIEFAEHLCSRSDSLENLRFVNSGTEAVMSAIKAARAYTGKSKIAKVEGAYHGLYDYAEVSQTANPSNWGGSDNPHSIAVAHGTPRGVLSDVIVIPFNDPARAIQILDRHASDIAGVLVDPLPHRVGLIPASEPFIQALRDWTTKNASLLMFDEVITFRTEYGGAQTRYGVKPDLTAMGKMIGGGFPVGAIAGNKSVMQVMNPLNDAVLFPHSGTFSANPITMTAGLTAMRLFDRHAVAQLNALTATLKEQLNQAIAISGVPACVTGEGSMFRVHLKPQVPNNYRDTYTTGEENARRAVLLDHFFANGIALINTCSGTLSTAHGQKEIDRFSEVLLSGLRTLAQ